MKGVELITNKNEIITLYKTGVCIDDIIEKYNCLEADIRHILKENNVDRHGNQFSQELYNRIIYLAENTTLTQMDICRSVLVSDTTVRRILKQNNMKSNRRKRISEDEIRLRFLRLGFHVVDEITNTKDRVTIVNDDGYKLFTSIEIINKQNSWNYVSPTNKYSIDNIKNWIRINYGDEYTLISDKYVRSNAHLSVKHNVCKTIFPITWSNLSCGHGCPVCRLQLKESVHVSVLKQIFLHEYPDTDIEEKSCINPITNRVMPTDIVNHRLKIAIEVQSEYHDREYKQKLDAYKKNYWIDKGYTFYDPDSRDYSVMGMVQLFFPNIKRRPDYIIYSYGDRVNEQRLQELLDKYVSINEICEIMGHPYGTIISAISHFNLKYPENYKGNIFYCFDRHMNKIKEFSNALAAEKCLGINRTTLKKYLDTKGQMLHGCYFIYKNDYDSNNYILRGDDYIHFDSVDVYDYDTKELITTANTVREFCKQHDIDSREVYEMIRHNKRRYQSCIIDDTPRRVYYILKEKPIKLIA